MRESRKGRTRKRRNNAGRKHTRQRDYTIEALVLLNQLKLIMNLWRAFMSALDTEFKASKKPLSSTSIY